LGELFEHFAQWCAYRIHHRHACLRVPCPARPCSGGLRKTVQPLQPCVAEATFGAFATQTTAFQSERRYDLNRNVVTQRWNHLGGLGEAYRYDDAYRLTETYEGVYMQGSDIDTFASGLPTNFRLLRDFTLDTRGNRTFVDSYHGSLGLVVSDEYDPNDDNNLYDEINGLSYSFDAARVACVPCARVAAVSAALVGSVSPATAAKMATSHSRNCFGTLPLTSTLLPTCLEV